MHDLWIVLVAPALMLVLLLAGRRWPVVDQPRWSALAYVLPFALACLLAFPSLDDWSYGASGRHGWWAAQHDWYVGWSGRIATTAVITAWGDLGSPWFAATIGYRAVVVAFFAGTCWAVWDVMGAACPRIEARHRRVLALIATAGWISLLRSPVESLYWLPGITSYGMGSICALVACGSLLRAPDCPRWRWWMALAALGAACLSGEVVAALALAAVAGATAVRLRGRDRWRGLAVLAGGLLCTAALVLAPGNATRALHALQEGQPPIDHAPLALARSSLGLMLDFITDAPWAPLAALGAWVAWISPAREPFTGGRILLLVPAFILVAALPMAWAGMSPGRAWNPLAMSSAVIVVIAAWRGGPRLAIPLALVGGAALFHGLPPGPDCLLVALGAWAGAMGAVWLLRRRLDGRILASALGAALLLGSERFIAVPAQLAQGPQYAMEQQRRMTMLAGAAPGSAVIIPRLTGEERCFYHLGDLNSSAKSWQNQGCASFFGLESVRTR